MFRSFRTRIALLAVALSSAVLAVFGVVAWQLAWKLGLDNVDDQIREEIRRTNNESRRPEFWNRLERAVSDRDAPGRPRGEIALLVRERGSGAIVRRTSNWPDSLEAGAHRDPPPPPPAPDPRGQPPRRGPGFRGGLPGEFVPQGRPGPADFRPGAPEGAPLGPPPPVSFGRFATVRAAGAGWRVGVGGSSDNTFLVAMSLHPLEETLRRLQLALLAAAAPGLLLIAAAGGFLAARALRPVAALTRTAEGITAHDLSRRIPVAPQAAEFQRLTDVFNDMLDRLEKSFQQATRFSADAAHELKTPLTILQGQLEESLRAAPDGSELQKLCAGLLEEVQRLKNIVRKLLLLSLADAGELRLQREPVDLDALVANAAEDARILASHVQVEVHGGAGAPVAADPGLIEQVLQNLVGNAIKYNRDGGFIRLELGRKPEVVCLAVTNSGDPIPARDQARLFERFYRGDPSRSKAVEGVGLGLSLAREIARAHGGDLVLETSDAAGTTFVLTLPVA